MPYIPPELIDKVKQMDLLTYLKNYEPYELVQDSRTQYSTKSHDSLKISNGYWNWCSVGIGGRNAVDYLIKFKGYSFFQAVNLILKKEMIQQPIYEPKQEKKENENLILPEKNTNENRVKEYLKSRGIDEEITLKCIEKGLIFEEKNYHNAVFVGYDENKKARYAGCRATNESHFKNDATGSNKRYSFRLESNKKTDTIYIFEGAIDLLSYATFFKLFNKSWEDKTMISLAGVYQPAKVIEQSKIPITIKEYLEKHQEIKQIVLCLDNDQAGRKATKALQTVIPKQYKVIDKPPKIGKDYNEFLCNYLNTKSIEKTKKLNKERVR